MELIYKIASIEDLEVLVKTRIEVLRAANKLDDSVDMSEVEAESRTYYKKALADGSHTAILVFDGDKFAGAGGVSYYSVIGTLYVSTVFVCMALAILSIKTLSGLDEEKDRFAILYRLGADITMQKQTVRRQVLAFFLSPFFLPVFATVPFGMFCGKVYEIWDFNGLSGPRAMEIAVLITGVIAGIYALYFFITYQIACNHVLVYGSEKKY